VFSCAGETALAAMPLAVVAVAASAAFTENRALGVGVSGWRGVRNVN